MENRSSMSQDYEIWVLLSQARDAILRAREKELRQYNISARQSIVMSIIVAIGEKATPAEISRWLFREPHSVSEFLSKMEREGLVSRVKDLDRKNLVRIVLTEKGREAYYQSTKRESIQKIMSSLSHEQRQQLKSCLRTLRDKALEEIGIEYKLPYPPSQ